MKLPRPDGRGILSPRFVGSRIPPKRIRLRSDLRTNALGAPRRGIKFLPFYVERRICYTYLHEEQLLHPREKTR